MGEISAVGGSSHTPIGPTSNGQRSDEAGPRRRATADRVELSTAAQMLSKLAELPDVRQDLVDRVRTQIELGTYETPEKIDVALAALSEDVA